MERMKKDEDERKGETPTNVIKQLLMMMLLIDWMTQVGVAQWVGVRMYVKMILVVVVVVPMFLPNCHNQLTPRLDVKRDSLERDSKADQERIV